MATLETPARLLDLRDRQRQPQLGIADQIEEWREAGVNGINVYHATVPGSFYEVADRLFPTLRDRGLISTDKSGTLRHKIFGTGDRLPERHPAAAYRGAFGDNDLLN